MHRAVRTLRLGEVFCVLCALGAEQRGREAGGGRIVRLEREDAAACRMRRLHVPLLARGVRGIAAAQPARERRCAEEHGVLLDYRSDGYEDERRVERVRRLCGG